MIQYNYYYILNNKQLIINSLRKIVRVHLLIQFKKMCIHKRYISNKSFQISRSFRQNHFSKKKKTIILSKNPKNPKGNISIRINLTISLAKAQDWPENNFLAKFVRLSRETRKKKKKRRTSSLPSQGMKRGMERRERHRSRVNLLCQV